MIRVIISIMCETLIIHSLWHIFTSFSQYNLLFSILLLIWHLKIKIESGRRNASQILFITYFFFKFSY